MNAFLPKLTASFLFFLADCWLLEAAGLKGRITNLTGSPILDAVVVASPQVTQVSADGLKIRYIAITNSKGNYVLTNLPHGSYRLSAQISTIGSGAHSGPCVVSGSREIPNVDIQISPEPSTVHGKVFYESDNIHSATVYVLAGKVSMEPGPIIIYGTYVKQGQFKMRLPPGTYQLKAISDGHESSSKNLILPGPRSNVRLYFFSARGTLPALADELNAMVTKDQDARKRVITEGQSTASFEDMKRVDEANQARLEEILHQYGWPTARLVGFQGMSAIWLLVQHGTPDLIAASLPHLKQAAERGEIEWSALALTIDRNLVNGNKPQIYGSQGHVGMNGEFLMDPVIDEPRLDERRAEIGLGPISEYKAALERFYRPSQKTEPAAAPNKSTITDTQ